MPISRGTLGICCPSSMCSSPRQMSVDLDWLSHIAEPAIIPFPVHTVDLAPFSLVHPSTKTPPGALPSTAQPMQPTPRSTRRQKPTPKKKNQFLPLGLLILRRRGVVRRPMEVLRVSCTGSTNSGACLLIKDARSSAKPRIQLPGQSQSRPFVRNAPVCSVLHGHISCPP
ncbi:hypothetical protein LZ31DRAFT_148800 [Colletotrichum somersetense]|nr:hypothetical protein LZ31DRAFT_148800 [Colletotrichum somersetense]